MNKDGIKEEQMIIYWKNQLQNKVDAELEAFEKETLALPAEEIWKLSFKITVMRMIPCIIERMELPADQAEALYKADCNILEATFGDYRINRPDGEEIIENYIQEMAAFAVDFLKDYPEYIKTE